MKFKFVVYVVILACVIPANQILASDCVKPKWSLQDISDACRIVTGEYDPDCFFKCGDEARSKCEIDTDDPVTVGDVYIYQECIERAERECKEQVWIKAKGIIRDDQASYRECLKTERLEDLRDPDHVQDEVRY